MSSSVFQDRIKSKKFILYVATLAIFLVDIILAVVLGVGGELFSIGLPVFIIVILDAILFLGVCFSNFRLKYSRTIPILYVIATTALGLVVAPIMDKNVFTLVALILFCGFRLISIIALIFAVVNGSNRGKGVKFFSLLITFVLVGVSVFYAINVFPNGFYGQGGMGIRNLSYEYDQEKDGYVANLIDDNKGDTVIIANQFNGKKVVGFDSKILACKDIKEIKLECTSGFYI